MPIGHVAATEVGADMPNRHVAPSSIALSFAYDWGVISTLTISFMHDEFAVDLKVARRKSGLSQADCAHLLGVDPSVVSKFEAGKAAPSVTQLTILYLVFGDGARTLWSGLVASLQAQLGERLASMPACPANWPDQLNRRNTLNALADRLAGSSTEAHV